MLPTKTTSKEAHQFPKFLICCFWTVAKAVFHTVALEPHINQTWCDVRRKSSSSHHWGESFLQASPRKIENWLGFSTTHHPSKNSCEIFSLQSRAKWNQPLKSLVNLCLDTTKLIDWLSSSPFWRVVQIMGIFAITVFEDRFINSIIGFAWIVHVKLKQVYC